MKNVDLRLINKFYSRQIKIPDIDFKGQEKINKSGLLQVEEDPVLNFTTFLCISIGLGTLIFRDHKNYYNDLKLRNPILKIKRIEEINLKELERVYVLSKSKANLDSFNISNIFYVNLIKNDKKIQIEFSKSFKYWSHDIKCNVDGRILACLLTAEIVKHILESKGETKVTLDLPEGLIS